MAEQETVVLRQKGKDGSNQPFAAKHAERLLAYPGTQWEQVPAEKAPKGESEGDKSAKAGK